LSLLSLARPLLPQTTVGTGSIVGTVSDPSGAVISEARVIIANVATGQVIDLTTNSSGSFHSGALVPGNYRTEVSAQGFSAVAIPVTVLVGNTATVNVKLQVGQEKTVVEVQAFAAQVNTEQPVVQGVLNEQQIENLPVNGRNFLDLAQLEPGVQIQDAASFGLGFKEGYSSISFGGDQWHHSHRAQREPHWRGNRRLRARRSPTDRVRSTTHLLKPPAACACGPD